MGALHFIFGAAVIFEAICILYLWLDVGTLKRRVDDYRDSLRKAQGEIIENKWEARHGFAELGLERSAAISAHWVKADLK